MKSLYSVWNYQVCCQHWEDRLRGWEGPDSLQTVESSLWRVVRLEQPLPTACGTNPAAEAGPSGAQHGPGDCLLSKRKSFKTHEFRSLFSNNDQCLTCRLVCFPPQGFQINQKVLASWSDCRYYPAKILSRDKDGQLLYMVYSAVVYEWTNDTFISSQGKCCTVTCP